MDEAGVTLSSAYKALGISPAADLREVKAAYRRLALQCHPDLSSKDNDEFRRLTSAYQRIINRAPNEEATLTNSVASRASIKAKRKAKDAAAGYRYEVRDPPLPIMRTVFNKPAPLGIGVALTILVIGSGLAYAQGRIYDGRYPEEGRIERGYRFTRREGS